MTVGKKNETSKLSDLTPNPETPPLLPDRSRSLALFSFRLTFH